MSQASLQNNSSDWRESLEREVEEQFKDLTGAHDYRHVLRVVGNALVIGEKEGADLEVLEAAALLHDLHRVMEKKTGRIRVPEEETLPMAEKLLEKTGFPFQKTEKVLDAIKNKKSREFSTEGSREQSLEAMILSDADDLDTLGAIGVARVISHGAEHNRPIYTPGEDLSDRAYDPTASGSSMRHFHDKILKLKDNMKTPTGKEMAEHRHDFLEMYLKEFFAEWEGRV